MIALISGTSEGKNIVGELNKFTDNILISTATAYGAQLFNKYKYRYINERALELHELKNMLLKNNVSVLIDASHPYAVEISYNCETLCREMDIKYLRYERPSVCNKYVNEDKAIVVEDYDALIKKIKSMKNLNKNNITLLNTTGSRNIDKFINSGIESRIVHRILPSVKAVEKCMELGISIGDIVAMEGPVGYKLNVGFIEQYHAEAIILKDSGIQGGTEEKIKAALHEGIYIFIIQRKRKTYENVFYNEKELVDYIKFNKLYTGGERIG